MKHIATKKANKSKQDEIQIDISVMIDPISGINLINNATAVKIATSIAKAMASIKAGSMTFSQINRNRFMNLSKSFLNSSLINGLYPFRI